MFPSLRQHHGHAGGWEAAPSFAAPSRSTGSFAHAYPALGWSAIDMGVDDAHSGNILTPRTAHAMAAARSGGGGSPSSAAAAASAARRHSGAPVAVAVPRSHQHVYSHSHSDADFAALYPSASASPVRSLRTPAGLALSYEHGGRHARAVRRELQMQADSPSRLSGSIAAAAAAQLAPSHATAGAIAAAAAGASAGSAVGAGLTPLPSVGYLPSLISHVHFTPVSPLPTHAGLAAMLNRVASPKAGTRTHALQSGDAALAPLAQLSLTVEETKEAVLYPAASAAPSSAVPMQTSPSGSHAGAAGEKNLTAVQRQRAYRAALLSKALSKPAVVHALDRRRVDNLQSLLSHRSQPSTLVKRRILPGEEAEKQSAELHNRKASLAHFFAPGARPSAEALAGKNILRERGDAESSRAAKVERLSSFIAHRPSVVEVSSKLAAPRSRLGGGFSLHAKSASTSGATATPLVEEDEEEGAKQPVESKQGDESADEEKAANADESADAVSDSVAPQLLQQAQQQQQQRRTQRPAGRKLSVFLTPAAAAKAGGEGALEKLSHFLETRPRLDELKKRNIVMSRQMSFSNLRTNVSKLLSSRPTMSDLKHMAADLLQGMVQSKLTQVKEREERDLEEMEEEQQQQQMHQQQEPSAAAAAAATARTGSASGSGPGSSPGSSSDLSPISHLSLESLQSTTLKVDEILAQKRRLLERKLRNKEEEVPGGAYMAGSNDTGQLGVQAVAFWASPAPLRTMLRELVAQVCCGWEHTLLRTEGGAAFAYGKNSYGQLGLGDQLDRDQPFSLHFRSSPLYKRRVSWVAANEKNSALVCSGGDGSGASAAVFTVGSLRTGCLGNGEDPDATPEADPLGPHCCRAVPAPLQELRGKPVLRVSLGGSHAAAVDSSGVLYVWGRNHSGALGTGDTLPAWRPAPIKSYGEFWSAEVSCGENHTAAIGFDNNCYLWGSNRNGQLGFQSTPEWNSPQLTPKQCPTLFRRGIVRLSAGRHHTACVSDEGEVYATLIIDAPKLADKARFHRLAPRIHAKDVAATPTDCTVAIDTQGCVYTWEPNALDEPRVDDTLETRTLLEVSAGLEHRAIVGSVNKSWRTAALEGEKK